MMNWIKKKILKWLGLDYQTYIGVDWHIMESTTAIIIRMNNDGTMEVVGDHRIRCDNYKEVLENIGRLCSKYNKSRVVHDFPMGFPK